MALPIAPDTGRRALPVVEAAGPIWRIWHPTTRTPAANAPRHYGPLHRFDPHPPGPPSHHDEVLVLYGSLAFEVSALEVFARGPSVVDVCQAMRGTLVNVAGMTRLFDLTDPDVAAQVGATPRLGDTNLDTVGYGRTQQWGRFWHASPGVHGLRYLSCRASELGGIAVVLFRQLAIGAPRDQHRVIDDALWPYLVHTLDAVGVAVNRVPDCPRC